MSRAAAKIAKAGESAIRAVHRLARTDSQETSKEQKRENKRKILLGCALIEMMEKDATLSLRVESFMKVYLQRPSDKRAFEMSEPLNFFQQARLDASQGAGSPGERGAALSAGAHSAIRAPAHPSALGADERSAKLSPDIAVRGMPGSSHDAMVPAGKGAAVNPGPTS